MRPLWCGPHRTPFLGRCTCTAGAENPLGGKTARPLILDSTITLQIMFWKGFRVSVRSLQVFCPHVQGPDQVSLVCSGIVIASILGNRCNMVAGIVMQVGVQHGSIVERDSTWADSRLHISDSVQHITAGGRATEKFQRRRFGKVTCPFSAEEALGSRIYGHRGCFLF